MFDPQWSCTTRTCVPKQDLAFNIQESYKKAWIETWRNKHHCNSLIYILEWTRGCCGIASKGTCILVILTSNLSFLISKIHIAVVLGRGRGSLERSFHSAVLCSKRHTSLVQLKQSKVAPPCLSSKRHTTIQNGEFTPHLPACPAILSDCTTSIFVVQKSENPTSLSDDDDDDDDDGKTISGQGSTACYHLTMVQQYLPQISTNSHMYKLSPSKSPQQKNNRWDCHGWNFFGLMVSLTGFPQLPVWGFQGGSPSILCHPTPEAASLGFWWSWSPEVLIFQREGRGLCKKMLHVFCWEKVEVSEIMMVS